MYDSVAVGATIVDASFSSAGKLKAGTYDQVTGGTADLTGTDAGNYTLEAVTRDASVIVDQKPITYSIASGSITYGADHTPGIISYSGLVAGDNVSASAQINDVQLSTATKIKVGTYTQSLNGDHGGDDVANYTITLATANTYVVSTKEYFSFNSICIR